MVAVQNFRNPFLISALTVAFLVYSGIFPVKSTRIFRTLAPRGEVCAIRGKISSNPVKNVRGFYRIEMEVERAETLNGGIFQAEGRVSVLVREDEVEACFPGKLYSLSNGSSALFEKGSCVAVKGFFSEGVFIAGNTEALSSKKTFFSFVARARALSRLKFRRLMYYWKDAGGLFLALVSGIREYTDSALSDAFRKAGLSHILALSGMHLSLFSGLSRSAFKGRLSERTVLFIQFLGILVFVWFAGLSPSLSRAFICSSLLILCGFLGIRNVSMTCILSLSFLIHAAIFPRDLSALAFKLSYGALAGILILGDFFTLISIRAFPASFASSFGASCGAQCFTAPISLRAFGVFSPIGALASVFVSPFVVIFIYSGILVFSLSFIFPFFAETGAILMNFLYNLLGRLVFMFSAYPSVSIGG